MRRLLLPALSLSVAVSAVNHAHADIELKATLDDIVASYMSIPNAEMFTTVHDISPQKPFIFFHVPKAGGSSLRETIYKAAAKAHLRSFIPCHGHIPCETYHFPKYEPADRVVDKAANDHEYGNVSDIAVYGAHFPVSLVSEHNMATLPFNDYYCMTNLRDPYDRIVSDIYYVAHQQGKWKSIEDGQCINDVDPFALKAMLQDAGETVYTFRFLSDHTGPIQRSGAPSAVTLQMFNSTLRHLAKCIPVVLEEPMSFKILSERYPQLGKYKAFDPATVMNVGRAKQACDKPTPAHARVLEESVQLERILYNAVKAKIRSRLSEVGLLGDLGVNQ